MHITTLGSVFCARKEIACGGFGLYVCLTLHASYQLSKPPQHYPCNTTSSCRVKSSGEGE